jgi:hypothetical protein
VPQQGAACHHQGTRRLPIPPSDSETRRMLSLQFVRCVSHSFALSK